MRHGLTIASVVLCLSSVAAWTNNISSLGRLMRSRHCSVRPTALKLAATSDEVDLDSLKTEILKYLEKRKEVRADERTKEDVGKVIGGTKGNVVLEYISGAPNKEVTIDEEAHPLDYSELVKYGFSHLATPIMKLGGRYKMYEILGLDAPQAPSRARPKSAPKLVIDKTGETDKNRYSGLKLGQVLDDDAQAEALERALKQNEPKKLVEEEFELPFADKRNTSPGWTPDWTPERLDEWGKQQGKAQAWARKAREGAFLKDPMETFELQISQRAYSILTVLLFTTGFGKSTRTFLTQTTGMFQEDGQVMSVLSSLQAPAATLALAALGSSVACVFMARGKNRSQYVWSVKGLLGGPLTLRQLRELPPLITQGEQDKIDAEKATAQKQ